MEKQDCRVRLRLLFERRRVLTKHQRVDGLDRCWFLLRSELSTVSDLACDITRAFHLQSTCPDGLLLSMDGFVLPPFESTELFRDNDLIRVRKNKGSSRKAIQLREDEDMVQIEDGEGILEKQPHLTCSPILAIEQFEKESGGYLTDEEEHLVEKLEEPNASNNPSVKKSKKKKKRKRDDSTLSSSKRSKNKPNDSENLASLCEGRQAVTMENDHCCSSSDNTRNIQGDNKPYNGCDTTNAAKDSEFNGIKEDVSFEKRRKKRRQTNDHTMVVEDTEANNQEEVSVHNEVDLRIKPNGIHKSPDGDGMDLQIGGGADDIVTDITEMVSMAKRQECLQEKSQRTESEPQANGEVKKVSSRSARRKKAKRIWLREAKLSVSKLEESQILNNHKNNARCSDTLEVASTAAGNADSAVIPIVVRPGHIRFEHSDEDTVEDSDGLHAQATIHFKSTGAIEWNGPLDKKKGQKWGRMRTSSTWNSEKIPQDGQIKSNTARQTITEPEDFEKLCYITGSPKVGDVLAYRLVELSSTWCPEVSSFRVGQITSYDPVTTRCTLVPVPGYAIPLDKAAEESEMLPEQSVYKDDGSLEIEFTSLVDVRLLDGVESGVRSTTSCKDESFEAGPSNLGDSTGEERNPNTGEASSEKEAKGWETWEDIHRALEKKKEELQQQNGADKQDKNHRPAKPSWSYRALRGCALGPTISLLRANNAL